MRDQRTTLGKEVSSHVEFDYFGFTTRGKPMEFWKTLEFRDHT